MTIRNLDALFRPRSVAVIGASERAGSIGRLLVQNLVQAGFAGPITPVNPKHESVLGLRAYPRVAEMPSAPDLAIIAIPAAAVPQTVAELARSGTRAAVVISAGFGARRRELEKALLDAARPGLVRIVGPNTIGIIVPKIGLNASFAHVMPRPGGIAFAAQSGAITTSVLDWAFARGIGFSHLIAIGDMADVDFGDLLDYLANDADTKAVLLYVEAVTSARKFMSAARAAARTKPVIVVKGGRYAQSAGAAASHTGRLAGPDAEYDAAFRRAGMLRVATLDELFAAVETLARARPIRGRRLAIVSNGGGLGVLAADALLDRGGELAALEPQTSTKLDACLPSAWSRANPIDIVGDATPERYAAATRAALEDANVDAVLVLHCPTAVTAGVEVARAVAAVAAERRRATVLTSWLGEHSARAARAELERAQVPTYGTPEQAAHAFMQMVDYRHNQELLLETPPSLPASFAFDRAAVREALDLAREEHREWLTAREAREVLDAYGIRAADVEEADSPVAAGAAAERIGGRVALKISAPSLVHKSDAGGVVLGLEGCAAVQSAAEAMLERVRSSRPEIEIRGFSVERMIERERGIELILGTSAHGDFGPVVLFGEGGTAVEVIADTALELPPLNLKLARALIERTRVARRLHGYRDVARVDIDPIALALVHLAQLIIDFPEIVEIDVNPLLAASDGVTALDARLRIALAGARLPHLAIRPYPRELEQRIALADGRELELRPILPEDAPALRAGFARLTAEEIRGRFFVPMKELPDVTAARFTQIDYEREMAFLLCDPGLPGSTDLHAVVRLVADPDNRAAEFAIVVEKVLAGRGLGHLLMRRLIEYARSRGIGELWGDVLADNAAMRSLCRSLGFVESASEAGVVRVRLLLHTY
jgi:acetyltransferase